MHVRRIPGGRFTGHVFAEMKVGDTLRFEGPLGGFTLRESERPILFVAGATGFAPVKSIVEDAFHRGLRRPMWLYWGVRRRQDLYMARPRRTMAARARPFHFVPVLSHAEAGDAWTGRCGLVHEAMLADFPDMSGFEVYVCGSVKMVEAAVPAFIEHGLGDAPATPTPSRRRRRRPPEASVVPACSGVGAELGRRGTLRSECPPAPGGRLLLDFAAQERPAALIRPPWWLFGASSERTQRQGTWTAGGRCSEVKEEAPPGAPGDMERSSRPAVRGPPPTPRRLPSRGFTHAGRPAASQRPSFSKIPSIRD